MKVVKGNKVLTIDERHLQEYINNGYKEHLPQIKEKASYMPVDNTVMGITEANIPKGSKKTTI